MGFDIWSIEAKCPLATYRPYMVKPQVRSISVAISYLPGQNHDGKDRTRPGCRENYFRSQSSCDASKVMSLDIMWISFFLTTPPIPTQLNCLDQRMRKLFGDF